MVEAMTFDWGLVDELECSKQRVRICDVYIKGLTSGKTWDSGESNVFEV